MFVRRRVVKGRTYYAVVQSYRDAGRIRHRQIVALRTAPDVPTAIERTKATLRRLRQRRTRLTRLDSAMPSLVHAREALAERLAREEARLAILEDVLLEGVLAPAPAAPRPAPAPPPRGRRFRLD